MAHELGCGSVHEPIGAGRLSIGKRWLLGVSIAAAVIVALAIAILRILGPKVTVVAVVQREVVQKVVVSGRVLPTSRINIGSVLAAVVAEVGVKEGDHVKAGDLLVQLNDAEVRATGVLAEAGLQQARARMSQLEHVTRPMARDAHHQADANLQLARLTYERQAALQKQGGATRAQLDEAKRALDVAQSQHDSTQTQATSMGRKGADHQLALAAYAEAAASVAQSEVRVAESRITAAVSARVLTRAVEPGELVQPGRTLIVLARDGKSLLSVQPDEKNLAELAIGQPAQASADAFANKSFSATVAYIAPSIDPQRGTVELRLDVPQVPAYLRPDMTVSVNIEVGRHAAALLVPREAVQDLAAKRPWVWLFQNGRIAQRSVELGLYGDGQVELVKGVSVGDRVVLQGSSSLALGQRVRASLRTGN